MCDSMFVIHHVCVGAVEDKRAQVLWSWSSRQLCAVHYGCRELNQGTLQEQKVLLTHQATLPAPAFLFFKLRLLFVYSTWVISRVEYHEADLIFVSKI